MKDIYYDYIYNLDEIHNKVLHHILDKNTGFPINNNLTSVTIITTSSTDADALRENIYVSAVITATSFINFFIT